MNRRLRLVPLFVIALVATLLGTSQVASAGTTSGDYLTATVSNQCARPVATRVANWFCPNTTKASANAAAAHARQDLGAAAVPIAPLDAAYCDSNGGCWDRVNSYTSTYNVTGWYGYGGTQLGDIQMYYKVVTTGASIQSTVFWISSSRGTKSIILSEEFLYISSAHPGGNAQNPRLYYQKSFATGAAGVSAQWSPATGRPNTVAWVTVANEASWSDPSSSYPGTWYFWGKSIKMQRQSNGSYAVQGSSSLPSSPEGNGWRS